MGMKKAPFTGAVENRSVANVEDKHSFHNKLVGAVIIIIKKSNAVFIYRIIRFLGIKKHLLLLKQQVYVNRLNFVV